MLQPGIPLFEIVKKVFQGLMWSFSDLEKWKMKWDQYMLVAKDLFSDPCRHFRAKAGMRGKSELKSHGRFWPGHVPVHTDGFEDLASFALAWFLKTVAQPDERVDFIRYIPATSQSFGNFKGGPTEASEIE